MYDYVAGKADWLAMGNPTQGTITKETIQRCVRGIPTCELGEKLREVQTKISDDWNICVVIDANRIVLGLLEMNLIQDSDGSIENLMQPAPLTLRPSVLIADALAYFDESHLMFALVTKSTGELIGAIRRIDLEDGKRE